MHQIKKYANRKMYDMTTKRYVTMDDISDLIHSGEAISITDNTTGEDITQEVVSQLVGRILDSQAKKLPLSVLMELMRKGSGGLVDFSKKYVSFWQGALNFAEDELDKVNKLIGRGKKEGFAGSPTQSEANLENKEEFFKLLDDRIETKFMQLLRSREAESEEHLSKLRAEIANLVARMATIENIFSQVVRIEKNEQSPDPKE